MLPTKRCAPTHKQSGMALHRRCSVPQGLRFQGPQWNYAGPWCPAKGGYGYKVPFPGDMTDLTPYWDDVNKRGSCRDYGLVKSGGRQFFVGSGRASCPAPVFKKTGRTEEGWSWWGRGVIQTTGVCNFGRLNYLGARGKAEGLDALCPTIYF